MQYATKSSVIFIYFIIIITIVVIIIIIAVIGRCGQTVAVVFDKFLL